MDAPLRLTFTVEVKAALPSLELGLSLSNLQNIEIVSTLSSWQRNLGPVAPGRYAITVDFGVMELTPGSYVIGAGLKSDQGMEDYVPEALDIEVVVSAQETRPNLNTIRGAIARTAAFTITPLP